MMDYVDAFRIYQRLLFNNGNDINSAILRLSEILSEEINCSDLLLQIRGIIGGCPVSIPGDPINGWYDEVDSHEYWNEYLALLEDEHRKNLPEIAITSVKDSTYKIMNFLSNPKSEVPEVKYGLVVGYVQSGKTANYSGLIARAADSGYKFIIVLTGGTSDLRNQTQKRLSKEVTGTLFDEEGCHVDQSHYSKKWNEVTKVTSFDGIPPGARIKDEGDISGTLSDKNDSFFEEDRPILIVMKKTGPSLIELNNWIAGIPETLRQDTPLLLIDDEADYASVNTSTDETANRVNEQLRTLLDQFVHRGYVAYTATPFANLFAAVHGDQTIWPTLFPRDFIMTLPEPQSYTGFAHLFPSGEYDNPYPFSRLCEVEENEATWVRTLTDTSTVTSELGHGLKSALADHLLTSALRSLRESRPLHQTMLVHTHRETNFMHPILYRIREQLRQWRPVFTNHPRFLFPSQQEELDFFLERYQTEFCEKWTFHSPPPNFEDIRQWIKKALKSDYIKVIEVSSDTDYATSDLDYDTHSNSGLNVIAVGGQKLSRGLTLEGLTISYFIRTAVQMQYDNLMQMGRWFGYRIGYSDLIRIHSTDDLIEHLTDVGVVEDELRAQIEIHEEQGWTPTQFAIKVLKLMDMIPCRPDAMRNITITSSSPYDRKIVPTSSAIFDFGNKNKLNTNLRKTAEFVVELGKHTRLNESSYVWENISNADVVTFLQDLFEADDSGYPVGTYDWARIRSYIGRRHTQTTEEFRTWDIALISNTSGQGTRPFADFNSQIEIKLPQRSRKNDQSDKIGTVHQPKHTIIGLNENVLTDFYRDGKFNNALMWQARGTKPLLLLYVFDKESRPSASKPERASFFSDEEEKIHVSIPVLVLPTAVMTLAQREEESEEFYTNQELPLPTVDDVQDEEVHE